MRGVCVGVYLRDHIVSWSCVTKEKELRVRLRESSQWVAPCSTKSLALLTTSTLTLLYQPCKAPHDISGHLLPQ